MQRFFITEEGYKKIKEELNQLVTVARPNIAKAIAAAMELGDLKENEEYSSAKNQQKFIDSMIATLNERLNNADVVKTTTFAGDTINFGAIVTLLDLNSDKKTIYQLLSEFESDLNKGIIAIGSLVGKALVGKMEGDEFEIRTPSGLKEYKVLKIEYK